MMGGMTMEQITITVYGEQKKVDQGITLGELAKQFQEREQHEIVLAFVNGKLKELFHTVEKDCEISFVTTAETIGAQTYRRSATILMLKAFYDVVGKEHQVRVMYSLSKGYYCEFADDSLEVTKELLQNVKQKMDELVAANLPISKQTLSTGEVISRFAKDGMTDKEKLFRYRRVSMANIYTIEKYEDYYYGYMLPSTGYIKHYDLIPYEKGFVLNMPVKEAPEVLPAFEPQHKLFQVLKQTDNWTRMLDVDTVGALNDVIATGQMNELILVQEALQEKNIAEIAKRIVEEKKKIVLIAGPSSSGKTTFSHRLSVQLRANGMKPHPIGLDDYFVNREDTPKDEDGNYNFECIEAIDLKTFNRDMADLLEGKRIELPTFNFQTGHREYRGHYMQIGADDVLVIEGIHGLNPKMTSELPEEAKFKIYISALTTLNIDEHNRIPTTDGRLIRRIVRDARTRGNSAQSTIAMWNSVRRGEEQNIFPYQEEADAMFNSALIYELSAIKQYAEPLLFSIPHDCPEYQEAKRLLKFLDYFLSTPSDTFPHNSILREFIGGSCFRV